MRKFLSVIFFLLCLPVYTACTNTQDMANADQLLLPLPPKPLDPTDEQARQAVLTFLQDSGAPVASTYTLSRADLDNDGRRDALVLFKTPYGYWCDQHGCTMLVFKAHDKDFSLISDVQPIREPLYVSNLESNGWKNLIVRVSGRWDKSKDVALMFDGARYPANPAKLPAYLRYASNEEMRLFYD